jgi:hypothetical protein
MLARALVLGWVLGVVVSGCAHAPPATSNQLAPGTIAWPATLDHESTPETHHQAAIQLLVEAGTEGAMTTMTEVMLKQQLEANPVIRPYEDIMRKFFQKYISFEAIRDDLAKLYTERFSELQLRQMLAFYQTPTGRLAVRELPKVIEAGAQLGRQRVEAHLPELRDQISKQVQAP